LFGCGSDAKDTASKAEPEETASKQKEETAEPEGEEATGEVIELQGFSVIIPPDHEGTGGHDGVKYANALIKPQNSTLKYEIEVGYGIATTRDDYQGVMTYRAVESDTAVKPVEAETWSSPGKAYTFIRTHGDAPPSLIEFQPEKGPSRVMGLYRSDGAGGKYVEAELRVTEGSIEDYPETLEKFMATYIDWPE
jgi:hypothetical protein